MQQYRYIFIGDVQGVGLRWTARNIARNYEVTGYVRNLSDGTVECLIEGELREAEAVVEEILNRMDGFIRKTTCQTAPASGKFANFDVAY
ncbi:MAG TPA: acylphosphatase [Phycisphaerae bacterium]|nr:acylphosphatase [Phycisphaerae bacterium]HPS53500.1 acylphosphatase [Phycisphaerae bacterium]